MDLALFHHLNGTALPGWLETGLARAGDIQWLLPWIFAAVLVSAIRGGVRWRVTLAVAALAVGACDRLNHHVVKEVFRRPRPCVAVAGVELREQRCPASFGFPSSHVSNTAAALGVVAIEYPVAAPAGLVAAALVGLSRIRGGVHYPGDVAGGLVFGFGVAAAVVWLGSRIPSAFAPRDGGRLVFAAALATSVVLVVLISSGRWRRWPSGTAPANEVLADLRSPEARTRIDASAWLREHCGGLPASSVSGLLPALADAEPQVRFAVAKSLGCLDPRAVESVGALAPILEDPVVGVREAAGWSLGRMGAPALSAVAAALADPDPHVRLSALHALNVMGAEARPASDGVERLLSDPDPRVHLEALATLQALRGAG